MPFLTAGDPDLATTAKLLPAIERAGGSIVELGIPFSDPIADGPVIQASMSHALDQHRVSAVDFDAAVFTNIEAHEHQDYHKTYEAYREAKASLFRPLSASASAVVNADDPNVYHIVGATPAAITSYGLMNYAAVTADVVRMTMTGTRLILRTPSGNQAVQTKLVGRHNVYNILAAAATAQAMGISLEQIAQGVEALHVVPGRLEPVDAGQAFPLLVDYCHTAEALRSVLFMLRSLTRGRLIVVVGCGGDRDESKRPLMAAAAEEFADYFILTADNSRTERTEDIIAQMAKGLTPSARHAVCVDRREAIRRAVKVARAGDVVLIAGKGHETYQILQGRRFPFDDRIEAQKAVEAAMTENLSVTEPAA